MGITQFPQISGDLWDMTPNQIMYRNSADVNVLAGNYIDIVTVSGKGVLDEFYMTLSIASSSGQPAGVTIVIDGVEIYLHEASASSAQTPMLSGGLSPFSSDSNSNYPIILHNTGVYKFKSGFAIRLRNIHTSVTMTYRTANTLRGVYYT